MHLNVTDGDQFPNNVVSTCGTVVRDTYLILHIIGRRNFASKSSNSTVIFSRVAVVCKLVSCRKPLNDNHYRLMRHDGQYLTAKIHG